MRKGPMILVTLLIVFFTVASGAAVYYFFLMPNNHVVPAFEEGKLNLVIEGEVINALPRIENGNILMPMDTIKAYIDPHIYWDDELKKVTITTEDRVIRMKTDRLDAYVNHEPMKLKIPASVEEGIVYIPIEFLSGFYNIEVHYLKESNVIIIDYKNSIKKLAEPMGQDTVVRRERTIRAPIIKKFDTQEQNKQEKELRIFEEYEKWYKVRTAEGAVGYIKKEDVVVKGLTVAELPTKESKKNTWAPEDGKINLVWEMMYSGTPDLSKREKIEGLDVLSPTWFQVLNEKGTLLNRADPAYVSWAHQKGYQVWALLSNDFNDPAMTSKILNNTDVRDDMIKQVLAYAALYKLDGINIDFENINIQDRDVLTQFVRELSVFLREQGLVVSIDVAVPGGSANWSQCYDHKALGEVVDYVALMSYDQHWASSPKAGSVAQYTWVEANVKKVVELVPKDKLLLGLPFYTRLWQEQTDKNGKVKVSSKALTMEAASEWIEEKKVKLVWDDESGQFYGEHKEEDIVYKIWVEDKHSIDLKSSLVHKYNLAGAAAWSKNFEMPEIWEVLNTNLKQIESYQEWASKNER